MVNKLNLEDVLKMSNRQIETELGKMAKELENLGMDRETSRIFMSNAMKLGVAAQEMWNRIKAERNK